MGNDLYEGSSLPLELEGDLPPGKHCRECGNYIAYNGFHKHKNSHDGRNSICKSCCSIAGKVRKEIRRTAPPMPEVCDYCGKPPTDVDVLSMDHNHKTNKFRSWLHDSCNRALGFMGDDIPHIRKCLTNWNNNIKRYTIMFPHLLDAEDE